MSRNLTVPEWLNESFLRTVLQQNEYPNTEVKVTNIDVAPAVAAGTNYVCALFRVRGKYQTEDDTKHVKDVSVIVKSALPGDIVGSSFGDSQDKEYIAYKEFLPEVWKMLKGDRFASKLLYSPDTNTMVLEDLKDQGFVMADRLKQLDFDHCLICLKYLAKFHAASIAVIKKHPQFIETLGEERMYDRRNEVMYERNKDMAKSGAYVFTKAAKTWSGIKDFENRSRRAWETLLDDVCDFYEVRKDGLNVLNHGDLWMNNIMFKYNNEGTVVDLRFIDFQAFRYTTPAVDVIYFLFTSAKPEVRENRMDELLSAYLETLNSVLEDTDCDQRLTREQLDAELKKSHCFVFWIALTVLIAVLNDPEDLPNLDEVTENNLISHIDNPFEKCYYGKYYVEIARDFLEYLDKEGYFDQ